jgi:hypothetical protein
VPVTGKSPEPSATAAMEPSTAPTSGVQPTPNRHAFSRDRGHPRLSFWAAAVVVVGGSLLLGGLTSLGQTYLPDWLRSLSNSMGGWTIFAFLLVWLSGARARVGAVLGAVSFVTLNAAYGLVSNWRGFYYADPLHSIWTFVGLVAGPVLGVAASHARHGLGLWRLLGIAVPAAVLLGEGCWALLNVADTTSPVYWWLEIVLSVVLMVAATVGSRPSGRALLLAIGVWLAGSVALFVLVSVIFA